jgi:hypothetical protein
MAILMENPTNIIRAAVITPQSISTRTRSVVKRLSKNVE